jgi:hypothetical protein
MQTGKIRQFLLGKPKRFPCDQEVGRKDQAGTAMFRVTCHPVMLVDMMTLVLQTISSFLNITQSFPFPTTRALTANRDPSPHYPGR